VYVVDAHADAVDGIVAGDRSPVRVNRHQHGQLDAV
jgi:hypothetical protein